MYRQTHLTRQCYVQAKLCSQVLNVGDLRGGRDVVLLKFRTMVQDAERDTGPTWSGPADPRVFDLRILLRTVGTVFRFGGR